MIPIPVMFLRLFTSGIQAFIFATLVAAYIGESMEGHEIGFFSLVQGNLCLARDNLLREHKYTYK